MYGVKGPNKNITKKEEEEFRHGEIEIEIRECTKTNQKKNS